MTRVEINDYQRTKAISATETNDSLSTSIYINKKFSLNDAS